MRERAAMGRHREGALVSLSRVGLGAKDARMARAPGLGGGSAVGKEASGHTWFSTREQGSFLRVLGNHWRILAGG